MDIQSILIFQIAADVVLCLAMAALLISFKRGGNRGGSAALDEKALTQLRTLLSESKREADRFSATIDECCRSFRELAADLNAREVRLKALLEKAAETREPQSPSPGRPGQPSVVGSYEEIVRWLGQGLSPEETAERTGTASGEVLLIAELEKVRQSRADQ